MSTREGGRCFRGRSTRRSAARALPGTTIVRRAARCVRRRAAASSHARDDPDDAKDSSAPKWSASVHAAAAAASPPWTAATRSRNSASARAATSAAVQFPASRKTNRWSTPPGPPSEATSPSTLRGSDVSATECGRSGSCTCTTIGRASACPAVHRHVFTRGKRAPGTRTVTASGGIVSPCSVSRYTLGDPGAFASGPRSPARSKEDGPVGSPLRRSTSTRSTRRATARRIAAARTTTRAAPRHRRRHPEHPDCPDSDASRFHLILAVQNKADASSAGDSLLRPGAPRGLRGERSVVAHTRVPRAAASSMPAARRAPGG